MIEAIENSLITACKNNFGKADNVKVVMNRTTGDFAVYAEDRSRRGRRSGYGDQPGRCKNDQRKIPAW